MSLNILLLGIQVKKKKKLSPLLLEDLTLKSISVSVELVEMQVNKTKI